MPNTELPIIHFRTGATESTDSENNIFRIDTDNKQVHYRGVAIGVSSGELETTLANYATTGQIPTDYLTSSDKTELEGLIGQKTTMSEVEAKGYITESDVPTKVSELTNDSEYITTADVPTKVSELTNDSGYITTADVPTKVSDLTNDSGFITSEAIPTNNTAFTNGAGYITIDDVPTIPTNVSSFNNDAGYITTADVPTKVSELTNDSGFITNASIPTNVSSFNNDAGYITTADVPTKVSDLTNDSGFITSEAIPTDNTAFTNGAGYITTADVPTKVSELTNDRGYITSSDIPTDLSDFNNDSGFITTADIPTNISSFNNDSGYITNADVPTKVSDLTNDSGFITSDAIPTNNTAFTNGAGYITIDDVPTSNTAFTNDAEYITTADIPTNVSEFTNDANYITSADTVAQANKVKANLTMKVNGTQIGTGTYNGSYARTYDITVPTQTSDLTNNSGFITTAATVSNANTVDNMTPAQISAMTNDTNKLTNGAGYITKSVNDLDNYYTKTSIDTLMSSKLERTTASTLPTTGEANTVYMIPKSTAGTNDAYDEYMYINSAWEHIGSSEVDLSNYYTKDATSSKTEISTALAGKSDSAHTHDYLPLSGGNVTGDVSILRGKTLSVVSNGNIQKNILYYQGIEVTYSDKKYRALYADSKGWHLFDGDERTDTYNEYDVLHTGNSAHTHDYLPLSGGIVSGITLSGDTNWLNFGDGSTTVISLVRDGNNLSQQTLTVDGSTAQITKNTLLHSGNSAHTHDYLPLSGGTVTGTTNFTKRLNVGKTLYAGKDITVEEGINFFSGGSTLNKLWSNDLDEESSVGDQCELIYLHDQLTTGGYSHLVSKILHSDNSAHTHYDEYLPLSGGTVSGDVTFDEDTETRVKGDFYIENGIQFLYNGYGAYRTLGFRDTKKVGNQSKLFFFHERMTATGPEHLTSELLHTDNSAHTHSDEYLPLSGGTVSGSVTFSARTNTNQYINIYSGKGIRFYNNSPLSAVGSTFYIIRNLDEDSDGDCKLNIYKYYWDEENNGYNYDFSEIIATQSYVESNYSKTSHTHSNYSLTSHTHSNYSLTNHTHSNYSLTSHTHDYLPLSGGTVTGLTTIKTTDAHPLMVNRNNTGGSSIQFLNSTGVLGEFGISPLKVPYFYDTEARTILHSGNSAHTHNYLPSGQANLTASTGTLSIGNNNAQYHFVIGTGSTYGWFDLRNSANTMVNAFQMSPDATTFSKPIKVSTVSGGTVSATTLKVSSTDVVSNLNADMVDGKHASAFSLTSHTHDYSDTYAAKIHTHTSANISDKLTATGVQALGWNEIANQQKLLSMARIAYWNGAYSGTSSNLAYCNKGAFGTMATQNTGSYSTATQVNTALAGKSDTGHTHDYLPLSGGTVSGATTISSATFNPLTIFRSGANNAVIRFENGSGYRGALGVYNDGKPYYHDSGTTSYELLHSGNSAHTHNDLYVPLSGEVTVTGKLVMPKDHYVGNMNAGNTVSGWTKFCTLTYNGTYGNEPIMMDIVGRSEAFRLVFRIEGTNATSGSFTTISGGVINYMTTGTLPFYWKKVDNKIELYKYTQNTYDNFSVTKLHLGAYMRGKITDISYASSWVTSSAGMTQIPWMNLQCKMYGTAEQAKKDQYGNALSMMASRRTGIVGSDTASLSNYWCKIASVTGMSNWSDVNCRFILQSTLQDYGTTSSAFRVGIRQYDATSAGTLSCYKLDGNFQSDRVRVFYSNYAGFEIWVNCAGCYNRVVYQAEVEGSRIDMKNYITTYNTTFSAVQTTSLSKYINPTDTFATASHTHAYLPLAGGTVTGTTTFSASGYGESLVVNRDKEAGFDSVVTFKNNAAVLGKIGFSGSNDNAYIQNSAGTNHILVHDGNSAHTHAYLPLSGGTMTGPIVGGTGDFLIWKPSANMALSATAANQEFSVDIKSSGFSGCYWHVWTNRSGNGSLLKVNADDGKVSAPYGFVGNLKGTVTGNVSGTASNAVKATQDSDGNAINTTYSKTGHTHNDAYVAKSGDIMTGRLVINPNGASNFSEGVRVNQATNGWALVQLGGAANSTNGTADGSWIIGRRGSTGTTYGAVGDLVIQNNGSGGNGVTVTKNGSIVVNGSINTASVLRLGQTLVGPSSNTGGVTQQYNSTTQALEFVFN